MLTTRVLTTLSNCRNSLLPAIARVNTSQCGIQSEYQNGIYCNASFKPLLFNSCHYCSASSATTTTPTSTTEQGNGILNRVLKTFSPSMKVRLGVASVFLYESVADKINYLTFFNDFNMPNTFNSWFLVTELHVWMLLLRSMAEGAESGQDGRFLRNSIVEAMWRDVNARAKKLGANNPSRTRKQIQELSEQFQAALIAYDEGIMTEDRVLAAALWRRFFATDCEEYEHIERLVKYVRQQVQMLDKLPRQDFIQKPKIPWQDIDKIRI